MPHLVQYRDSALLVEIGQHLVQIRQLHRTHSRDHILVGARPGQFAQFAHFDEIVAHPLVASQLFDALNVLAPSFTRKVDALDWMA